MYKINFRFLAQYGKLALRRMQNFGARLGMFVTPGYVLIVCVLVKSGFLHTFRTDFSKK